MLIQPRVRYKHLTWNAPSLWPLKVMYVATYSLRTYMWRCGGDCTMSFFRPMYVAGLERLEKFQELLVSYTHVHVHVHACTCMYSSTVYGLWLSNTHYVCWDVYGLSYLNLLTFFPCSCSKSIYRRRCCITLSFGLYIAFQYCFYWHSVHFVVIHLISLLC